MKRLLKILAVVVASVALLLAIAASIVLLPKYFEYKKAADSVDLAELEKIPAISEVFDNAGMRYSRLSGEVRYVVPYSKISPYFIKALLAREDSRFYDHHGVDYFGIVRAAMRNFSAGGVKEGASTITQQLARNTFPLGDDKWRRKGIEALLALRIEKNLNKEKILEAYANRIYYGAGLYGVETASRACFGKSASDLTLSEAAILAGLIRSPNRLSPLEDTRTALTQRDQVLARMEELGLVSRDEAAAARREPMPLAKRLPPPEQENYAMDTVMRDLAILLPPQVIQRGGLKIYTTIDRRLQLIAEDAVDEKLAAVEKEKDWKHPVRPETSEGRSKETRSPYVQGALVAIDNTTGGILAVVGGRDFEESPYNRAIIGQRQIGSTFKPFVYAAAFAHGMVPGTFVDDSPILSGEVAGTSNWSPKNSDGQNVGLQPVALGLVRSRNTMTVRVGEYASREAVRDLGLKAGFDTIPDMPAIYLGAFETTLKNLTAAYTMFANGGIRRQPFIIDYIEDRDGKVIYRAARAELPCLSPGVSYVMNELLRDVVEKGTAASAKSLGLKLPAAGKTGTTDDFKDAWFVGYTTRVTCGVWVGFDEPQRIASGGYGSKLALPIWVDFMQQAASFKYEAANFAPGPNVQTVDLCRVSGDLATQGCLTAGTVYRAGLPSELIHRQTCAVHGPRFVSAPLGGRVYYPSGYNADPAYAASPGYTSVAPGTPYRPANTATVSSTASSGYSQPAPRRPAGPYMRYPSAIGGSAVPVRRAAPATATNGQPVARPIQAVPADELNEDLTEPYRPAGRKSGFIFNE